MKLSLPILILLLMSTAVIAQDLNPGNQWTGKTDAALRQGRNNLFHLQQAQVLLRQMDMEGAFFALENAVSENPQSANMLIHRARFKKMIGMETEALEDVKLAIRINPYAADIFGYNGKKSILKVMSYEPLKSAEELSLEKRMDYYYEWLDQFLESGENDSRTSELLYKAIDTINEGDFAEAEIILKKAIKQNSKLALAYDLQGLLYIEQENYAKAAEAISTAISLQPNFAIAWYNYGRLERAKGNLALAESHFNRAIYLQEDLTKAYFDKAMLLKSMGDKIGAIQNYNAIIEQKGEGYVEALLNRGLTYKEMGEFTDAQMDLNKVIEIQPDNAILYKNRANLYLIYGQHLRAIEDYSKAIELDNNFAQAYYNRGLTHLIMHDNVSACKDFQTSAALNYEQANELWKYSCGE